MRHLADDQRREEMAMALDRESKAGLSKGGAQKIGKATEDLPGPSGKKGGASRKLIGGEDNAKRSSLMYGLCACLPGLFSSKKFDPVGVSGP